MEEMVIPGTSAGCGLGNTQSCGAVALQISGVLALSYAPAFPGSS